VWGPALRPEYDCGELQDENAAPSSEHWKTPGSVEVKLNLADVDCVVSAGRAVIVVSGADVSGG
jgi:hypothetical protein